MKRGVKTIIAGVVLFLLGAFVTPLLIALPLILDHEQEPQFKAPGRLDLAIKKPGRYYLWNDFQTVYNGKTYDQSERLPGGLEIRILDASGNELPFASDGSISQSNGNSAKKSVGYVEIKNPGNVSVWVTGGNEERIFSFSQSGLLKIFAFILGVFGLSCIVSLGSLGIIIWGIVKLVRASRKVQPISS